MSDSWRYEVEVQRDDGTLVQRVAVAMDWEPLHEWARFEALARGAPPVVALGLTCVVTPQWDERLGAPFMVGAQARTGPTCVGQLSVALGREYFADGARRVVERLVEEGVLEAGTVVRCHTLANPEHSSTARPRFTSRPTVPAMSLDRRARSVAFQQSVAVDGDAGEGALPVVIDGFVLDELRDVAQAAGQHETGGLLVGHIRRDPDDDGLFLEVSAQLPAAGTKATSTRLTFTSESWEGLRHAITGRGRGEVALGWYHTHPSHAWCRDCAPERRASCRLRQPFLSADDRLLHRTVFPRAWSVALLVNQRERDVSEFALFGWTNGLIARRGYHRRDVVPRARRAPHINPGGHHAVRSR
ncbi:MAG: Mov34/MPN/PAD-1 family protein [Gemmatimonadetes bacterium]|nr:Mov34/MPN/PAD-1 family protein [Gemmatimonadota bacterium]